MLVIAIYVIKTNIPNLEDFANFAQKTCIRTYLVQTVIFVHLVWIQKVANLASLVNLDIFQNQESLVSHVVMVRNQLWIKVIVSNARKTITLKSVYV